MVRIQSELTRARGHLRLVTFVVIGLLGGAVAFLAAGSAAGSPTTPLLLGAALGVALSAFMLYVAATERALADANQRATREQLETERLMLRFEADREREAAQRDFVSIAAHELRAPVTAIKGYARTLATKADRITPERRTEFLGMVNDQSERLAHLVDDLLRVSRIDAGRISLSPSDIDLAGLAEDVRDQFGGKWEGRRIDIVGDPETLVHADRNKTEEILINLIDNAVKYSPESAPVRISVRRAGSMVEVSVRDEGCGVGPDDLKKLFHRFVRLPATASSTQGTGLGLYIVKAFVEAHGGNICARSTPGEGSTFTFSLPAANSAAGDSGTQSSRAS